MMKVQTFLIVILMLTIHVIKAYEIDVTDKVKFTISIENDKTDSIEIGLFGKVVPNTVENFVQLSKGYGGKSYNGTKFHRVISNFMIQGGDVLHLNGSGSFSIYGEYFDDENFVLNHGQPGLISMANAGKNTNGCQFFITLVPTPWLDGHHTVFGKVLNGMDFVYRIGSLPTDSNDQPKQMVQIVDVEHEQVDMQTTLE